ncbi:MAG TPA: hypothetical protein PKW06_05210 [Cyclobacteriaceae bacterium]|nr:hypothetical protein [Cyclobacteriaceae bacterium]
MGTQRYLSDKAFLKAIVATAFLVAVALGAWAQLLPRERYEKEVKQSDNNFIVIPMEEEGIALVRGKNKYKEGNRLREIILLDTSLKETWQSDLEVKSSYDMVGYEYGNHHIYLLFREGSADSREFILASVNVIDHSVNQFEIKHEFLLRPIHFTAVGGNVVFGGYVSTEPAVMLYETSKKVLKVIPGFFLKDTELLDVRPNKNNTFNTLLVERNSLDKRHLVLKTFDAHGGLLLEDEIEIDKDVNILTGITSSLKREELILLGTYTIGTGREAVGFYSTLADPFTDQKIHYTPFTDLSALLGYLPAKRASRIKERSKERDEAGKTTGYKAYVLPIRIEENEDGFYLLSEMYDPASTTGRSPRNSYFNPYYGYGYSPYGNNPFTNRYSNSPYTFNNSSQNTSAKMIESVLTLFDGRGKLVWDTSLQYDNVKRYATEQISDFTIKDGLAFLSYSNESKIIVNTGSVNMEPELDTLGITLKYPTDLIRNEADDDSGMRYWYGGFSFVWGYQSIKNTGEKTEDPVRYVFYINKFEAE